MSAPVKPEDLVLTPAADFRVKLNLLFSEHLIVAAKITGAAQAGRGDEFMAYAGILGKNTAELKALMTEAIGADKATEFDTIWTAHNNSVAKYTMALAMNNLTLQQDGYNELTMIYLPQFAKLMSDVAGLPLEYMRSLTAAHITTTKGIIDAQGMKDYSLAYQATNIAFDHMKMFADPIAQGISFKNPTKYIGNGASKPVDLRVTLNQKFQQHLYLASMATGALVGGRMEEVGGAGPALNQNGTEVGAAVGTYFGAAAQDAFNTIWSDHNNMFVAYTTATAAKDATKQMAAVTDLTTKYVPMFSKFLADATGLPMNTLSDLTMAHVLTAKAIVDAQVEGDFAKAAEADRTGAEHMRMMADPLSKAIVTKLPMMFTP